MSLYLFVSQGMPPFNDYSIVFNGVQLIGATDANAGGGMFNFIPIMATSNFTTLAVSARNRPGTYFDNVSVTGPTAVPENGSSALLLSCGLAGLFVLRRGRYFAVRA